MAAAAAPAAAGLVVVKILFEATAAAIMLGIVNQIAPGIAKYSQFNAAREEFTKKTVKAMWDANPGDYDSAVCYNMAYEVSNTTQMYELTSVKISQDLLYTTYDCFYMSGPDNHFNSYGDGGYINLAIYGRCQFDKSTSDLYCP